MISFSSFADEFVKIAAMPNPMQMKNILQSIGRSAGKMGPKAVPKATPMTATFRGGKMIKTPLPPPTPRRAGPPPIPGRATPPPIPRG